MPASADRRPSFFLSLRAQIGLSLSLLSLLLLGAGAISLLRLADIKQDLHSLLANEDARSHAASELAIATLQARRFEKDMLLSVGDAAAETESRARWDGAYAQIEAAFDELAGLSGDEDEVAELERWRGLAAAYRASMDAITAQIAAGALGNPDVANVALEPGKAQIRQLTDEALAAAERDGDERDDGQAHVLESLDASMTMLLWLGAVVAVAALGIILLAPRRLVAPLVALRRAAEDLSAGRRDVRVAVHGRDEVAQLGASFNQMAETIERQMGELDQTAVVREQNDRLQELLELVQRLETPVIGLYHDVLLVPLVGHIDSVRAEKISRATLDAIFERKANTVLVDVTGISEMNTEVAKYLQELAAGARLLGARMILTGVRAETAQVIVRLGLSLAFETMGQLQDGVSYVTRGEMHSRN